MSRRKVLTEVGPDASALQRPDREAVLFDLVLDVDHVDICIRTSNPGLLAALRAA